MDYITPVDSSISVTQGDFSDPTNHYFQKEEIKGGAIRFIEAFIRLFIYLFNCLILIGCKEIARCLSEAEGVSEAKARVLPLL